MQRKSLIFFLFPSESSSIIKKYTSLYKKNIKYDFISKVYCIFAKIKLIFEDKQLK